MKKLFPGYYKPSEEEFKKLWDNALFVFDTNVLLDIHRFSKNTKKTLIGVIQHLDSRLWIPHRVAFEYHRNLNDAINDQLKNYEEAIKKILELDKHISHSRHPFLDKKDVHIEIKKFCTQKQKQLISEKNNIEKLFTKNPIKDKLADLLSGKIGQPPPKDEIEKIYNEGEKRYREKIPPGFKDPESKGLDRYGDLLIWKEILQKAKSAKKDIILVTNDSKQDWYLAYSHRTLGPNPLLINEFIAETSRSFYAYQTRPFLKHYAQHFTKTIAKDVLMEVEKDNELFSKEFSNSFMKIVLGETFNTGSTKTNS